MERIGIRELRQHASRYLARVASGETVEVTDRGRLVARLVPVSPEPWVDLVMAGRVLAATDATDVAKEPASDYGIDASSTLAAMREGER